MSGAHTNGTRPASDVIDLDAMLAGRSLAPKPLRFHGHTYQVRTDLTPAEIIQYHQLAGIGRDAEAYRIIVGEDGDRLNEQMNQIPRAHLTFANAEFLKATGCFDGLIADPDGEDEGESSASSSASSDQTGTPPSQPSDGSTTSTSGKPSSKRR